MSTVGVDEIASVLTGLDSTKATGYDGFPVKFLKVRPQAMGYLLTRLTNRSITSSTFHDLWNGAVVTLIQKSKGNFTLSNIVSNLCLSE